MSAVQPIWSTALNPRPEEVILRNVNTTGVVTIADLCRAMARLVGVSNLELLGISFHGDRCYVTLHAAPVQLFI